MRKWKIITYKMMGSSFDLYQLNHILHLSIASSQTSAEKNSLLIFDELLTTLVSSTWFSFID
jgi:hypothetical protein